MLTIVAMIVILAGVALMVMTSGKRKDHKIQRKNDLICILCELRMKEGIKSRCE